MYVNEIKYLWPTAAYTIRRLFDSLTVLLFIYSFIYLFTYLLIYLFIYLFRGSFKLPNIRLLPTFLGTRVALGHLNGRGYLVWVIYLSCMTSSRLEIRRQCFSRVILMLQFSFPRLVSFVTFFLKGSIHALLAMFSGRSHDALRSFPFRIALACHCVF